MTKKGQQVPHGKEDTKIPSASPRQPQFNPANCGCPCRVGGLVGNGEGGGGDNDADGTYLDGEVNGEEGVNNEPLRPAPPLGPIVGVKTRFDTRYADFEVGREGFRYGTGNMVFEHPFSTHLQLGHSRAGTPDSLANHFRSSDGPSLSSSEILTPRSDSPGPVFSCMGEWSNKYNKYYFSSCGPLSLAPQHQIPLNARLQAVGNDEVENHYEQSIASEELNDVASTN